MIESLKFCGLDTCEYVEAATKAIWVIRDKKGGQSCYQVTDNTKKENCLITIDGGLITASDQSKCDYLFVYCEKKYAYFVELKGRNFEHAIEQITNTINSMQKHVQHFDLIHARIVLSKARNPDYVSTALSKLKRLLAKCNGKNNHPAALNYKAQKISETIP